MDHNHGAHHYADLAKLGWSWKACHDKAKDRYLGYICHTCREGQERFTYEIPKSVYDALDLDKDSSENEALIKTGRMMAHFEASVYGPPIEKSFDDEGEKAWTRVYESVMDELQARFERGDEGLLGLWEAFVNRTEYQQKRGQFLVRAAEGGVLSAQEELAQVYCYDRESRFGIKPDSEKAAYWYELFGEKASAKDQSYLGYLFSEGSGSLKKDTQKARYWLNKAIEGGYEHAKELLASLEKEEAQK